MLHSLKLSNFQKHAEIEIEFSPGTTIITGKNWAGKSTILRGVLYAMFGPSAVPGGSKILQRRGTKKKPWAELCLTIEGKRYTIIRGANSARLLEDGEKIATGASVVTDEVERLTGYPGKLFTALRTAPQEEAASILTLGYAKLSEILNSITQVDVIDRVLQEISGRRSTLKAKIAAHHDVSLEDIQSKHDLAIPQLQAEYNELSQSKEKLSTLKEQTKLAGEQLNGLSAKCREAATARDRVSRLKGILESLSDQRLRVGGELAQLQESGVPDVEKLNATYIEQWGSLQKKEEREKEDIAQQAAFKSTKDGAERSLKEVRAVAERLGPVGEEPPEAGRLAAKQAADLAGAVFLEAKSSLKSATTAAESSFCPTCNRPYEEGCGISKEQLEAAVAEALEALQRAKEEQSAAVSNSSAREKAKESFDLHQAQVKAATDRVIILEERYAEACEAWEAVRRQPGEDLRPLREKVAALQDEYQVAHRTVSEINRLRNQSTSVETEMASVEHSLSVIPVFPEGLEEEKSATEKKHHELRSNEHELGINVTRSEAEYAEAYRAYERLAESLSHAKKMHEAQTQDRQSESDLTALSKYLVKNRDSFTEQVWASLLDYASQFVNQATGGAVTAVSRDAGGNFTYQEGEEVMPIQAASGLQKAILGTSVRLALAEAVRANSNFFLLDEVTAGASDEASMAVTNALGQTGLQIITVTHRPADAAVADRVVSI